MADFDIFEQHAWRPLAYFGITHPFFDLSPEPIYATWVALGILTLLALLGRLALKKPHSASGFIARSYVRSFITMTQQSLERTEIRYIFFITSLFTFILTCNWLVLIPGMEEPTKNLNTTLALGLLSFAYTQKEAIKKHGLIPYLNEFFKTPIPLKPRSKYRVLRALSYSIRIILNTIIGSALLPFELLGKCATIISISFRLFGNIFGGSIIHTLWSKALAGSALFQLLGFLFGINLIILVFFGIFEGAIQAFVFTVLTLTYLTMATQHA